MAWIDCQVESVSRGRPQPVRKMFGSYPEAIAYVRRKIRRPGAEQAMRELPRRARCDLPKIRRRAALTTSFRIFERGELVLEVWHDRGLGRWQDRGKYA